MKKINLKVMCKRDRFDYWNSCKCLSNSVNVAALLYPKMQAFNKLTTIL